jgi:hypothetical protein
MPRRRAVAASAEAAGKILPRRILLPGQGDPAMDAERLLEDLLTRGFGRGGAVAPAGDCASTLTER